MSPVVRSSGGRLTSGIRQISRNPSHFRSRRWLLVAEGTLLIVLGGAGFVSDAMHPDAAPAGAQVLVLALTPWHSGALLGFGVLALIGSLTRRAAITVAGVGAVTFLLLVIAGAVVRHPSGARAAGPGTARPRVARSVVGAQLRRPVLASSRRARRARLDPSVERSPGHAMTPQPRHPRSAAHGRRSSQPRRQQATTRMTRAQRTQPERDPQ